MTSTVDTSLRPQPRRGLSRALPPFPKRILVALLVLGLALAPGDLGALTRDVLVDAYLGVAVFVAATLILFYGAEKLFAFNLHDAMRRAKWLQVPAAAFMGMLPGCGGAVVVVAAYSSGSVGMGSVVAALTATMGDAAFLLLAARPDVALVVLPVSLVVGILSGYAVDAFTRAKYEPKGQACDIAPRIGEMRPKHLIYTLIAAPGLVFGVLGLAQVELPPMAATFEGWIGLAGIAVGLFLWATSPVSATTSDKDGPITRMAEETAFIVIWVIGAFLAYEYLDAYAGLDLRALFQTVAPLLPLIAILIGFIPGCGPQVLVTTLFINGLIPFSALIGNAIANDGDALFPAIALNPKAALMATLYSAVPAVIVAYGFYLFAPNFMLH